MIPLTEAKFPSSHLSTVSCWKERRRIKHHHGKTTFLTCCTFYNGYLWQLWYDDYLAYFKETENIWELLTVTTEPKHKCPYKLCGPNFSRFQLSIRGLISSSDDKYHVSKLSVYLYKVEVTSENSNVLYRIIYLISRRRKPRLEVSHQNFVIFSTCRSGATYGLLFAAQHWLGPEVQAFFLFAAFCTMCAAVIDDTSGTTNRAQETHFIFHIL